MTAPGLGPTVPAKLPVAVRREQLRMRSAQLRTQVAAQLNSLNTPLALADGVREGAHWLVDHRQWVVGGLLVLTVWRPSRAVRWGGRFWWAWRSWQRVGRLVQAWGPAVSAAIAQAAQGQRSPR